ncbi:MAG TPA: acyl-CoA dehydrogenase family protein [Acidimicrobiia bacterium]
MSEVDDFRVKVREFLATHATTNTDGGSADRHDDGDAVVVRGKTFQNALADAGLAALTYPVEFGGAGLDAEHQKVFDEESNGYEMPSRQFMVGIGICAPTLLEYGTDEQRRTYLPALLRADAVWCQLFSEPGAGSDVASLQTRAERDGDEWVVNGQKVWTSGAHYADYGLLVARTNRDVPKHRGISMFIVDMHSPGITSRPLRQIDGRAHFNEVFLDDVRLPADAIVGQVDDGWRVTLAMLANERVAIGAGGSSQSLSSDGYGSVLRLARARGRTDDPEVRQELAELYVLERILALLGMRIREALVSGRAPGPEGSVAKLAATVLGKQSASLGMAIAGAGGLAWSSDDASGGHEASAFLFAPMLGIAGGTTEIQKNIIGERVLGLPKDPAVDKDLPFRDLLVGTQKS